MNKVINFVIWPAVAGLAFGFALLQMPRLAQLVPGIDTYLPPEQAAADNLFSFSYSDAISKAAPAVVSINSTSDVRRSVGGRYLPGLRRPILLEDESTSLGSGVIISADGYIIPASIFSRSTTPTSWIALSRKSP